MTKNIAKTALVSAPQIEIGLACDASSSNAGIYGLTDLFTYAGEFAAKRHSGSARPVVRITHWRADDAATEVRCAYDSCPGSSHALSLLVVPGNVRAPEKTEKENPLVCWLRQRHAEGVVLAAVCGGVFILARTGLLAGRQATTHWSFGELFAEQFPDVLTETNYMVIDYGDVVTAGGVLAWADLGLRLTERFLGTAVMLETARFMLVDPPGREQRFYSEFDPRTKHGDRAILRSQHWLFTQRERPVSVVDIAQHAGLEPRTFLRRFVAATGMKPSEYQQQLRVTRAREMLEFSQASIEEISWSLGYGDVEGFRRVFRKVMGLTPSDYRRRFCRPTPQRVSSAPDRLSLTSHQSFVEGK